MRTYILHGFSEERFIFFGDKCIDVVEHGVEGNDKR